MGADYGEIVGGLPCFGRMREVLGSVVQICGYFMDTFWEKKIVGGQREIREQTALQDNVNEKQNTSVEIIILWKYLVMFMG